MADLMKNIEGGDLNQVWKVLSQLHSADPKKYRQLLGKFTSLNPLKAFESKFWFCSSSSRSGPAKLPKIFNPVLGTLNVWFALP